jgi:outer membrane protein insertion porin family
VNYRDITQFTSATSDFSTTSTGATLDYGYPLSEYQSIGFGVQYQHAELLSSFNSTQQSQDWVLNNGNQFIETGGGRLIAGTKFDTYEFIANWSYDSRNRALFPTRGMHQQLFMGITIPGSEVEYYSARYNFTKYWPVSRRWILSFNAETGITGALGDTTAAPPYKQYYAGGPKSIRGYRESYLGPRDSFGRPYGGNVLAATQLELIIPLPGGLAGKTRASLFYDAGNAFNTGEVDFTDKLGSPVTYKPDFTDLRTSAGVSVQWLSPMGLFQFSYAFPLNAYDGSDRYYEDETEKFQFSIGQAF